MWIGTHIYEYFANSSIHCTYLECAIIITQVMWGSYYGGYTARIRFQHLSCLLSHFSI